MPHTGSNMEQLGYVPRNPVILVPGYMSTCLEVQESPWREWSDRKVWLSMQAMGFEKVFTDALPMFKKYSEGLKSELLNQRRDTEELSLKRKWIQHMVLDADDGISDPEGTLLF
eukprot:TRINITY_DN7412_c0_g1_i3.p1 TRINITY_DN7412_c0_g1~~TRINITY_DN7412_c0_g1_i3.p1  ORF type:complete len:114 (+),score=19.75 TRINITY_DN7412_c0_g1_i3:206-547(+)